LAQLRGAWSIVLRIAMAALLLAACGDRVVRAQAAGPAHSIVLAPTLVAEAPATLAVLDASGRLVPGVSVVLSDGHVLKTDLTGRARWVVSVTPGPVQARIPHTTIVATAMIVTRPAESVPQNEAVPAASAAAAPAMPATSPLAGGIEITDCPPFVDARDQFTVSGTHLEGDADENHVMLGGQAVLVLASSPTAIVLLPSAETPLGPGQFQIEGNGRASAPLTLTVVELDAVQPAGPLRIGVPAILIVHVRGSTAPLDVEVGNWSPAVIKMLPNPANRGSASAANIQRVRTSGGDKNEAQIQIVPLAPGKFLVHARLVRQHS
jgi:hypothetical protein